MTNQIETTNDVLCTEYPEIGPYILLSTFQDMVEQGVFGPDEDTYWVCVTTDGFLKERRITHPSKMPPGTIAVAYYAA